MNPLREHFVFKSQQDRCSKASLRKKKKGGGSQLALKIPPEGAADLRVLSLKIHSDKFAFETDLVFFR